MEVVSHPQQPKLTLRRAGERGLGDHGWLRSFHTFSFANYHDPEHMGFRSLRVINEDRVAPGMGFGAHPHRDMEIVSIVLEGELQHKDSMGNGSVIRPGEVQRMTAGTGVVHSERNPGKTEVHFLQIWILPEEQELQPSYEQRAFPADERRDRLRLLASRDGSDGSVTVHQDVRLYSTIVGARPVSHTMARGRFAWVHVARGAATLNGQRLEAGDAASTIEPGKLELRGAPEGEVLIFDLG